MATKHDILKRTLSLVLALVMTASCVPFQAFAAETETIAPTEAVETTPTETTAPTELPVPETVPETTAETTAETVPETTEATVPETTEETVPEIAVTLGETAPVLLSEPLDLSAYQGKVISILGASTCTFAGYIPVADGFNLEHYARYPQDNLLTDVNDTWWMQVINTLDAKLGINDSWRSTEVYNACTEEVNSSYDGTKACLSSITRIQNLGSNGTPDVILFFGGINDITQRRPLGTFNAASAPKTVDLTAETWETVAEAYTALIMRLQYYYPSAKIVALLPYSISSNSNAVTARYTSVFAEICKHYGVSCIDLMDCGISTGDLPDGTHPNAEGMDYITEAVLQTLAESVNMEAGENVVYSVSHKLNGAKASLGYYKGVSAGAAFVETLEGEALSVTVTMGGKDITASAYVNGKVSIPKVTGDLVITAKGIYDVDGRLQKLPDNYCCNTNLWTQLEPVNEYYTPSGWGNNSNSNYSVTFPVTAGDHIWATSFGTAGTNGYSANAVRITWFGENGVLKSLDREAVYGEFAEYGYLTVPEGAVALNIPMASNSTDWEIYILNRPHSYSGGKCAICGEATPSLAGKTLSILGASISTFEGTSNGAAADTTNSTIRKNAKYYPNTTIPEVTLNDTWWMQVCEDLGLRLLVNNAWSGSSLLYERGGTVGAYVDRCVQLHDDTGDNAGETPDIIGIQMGTNDFQYYKDTLGTADIDYAALIQDKGDGTFTYAEPTTSLEAAAIVLHKISVRYPNAEVYYLNISQRVDGTDDLIRRFNADLKKVVEHFGAHIVDIFNSAITMEDFDTYIGDGRVHPNKLGMDAYTEAFKKALLANTGYVVPETHTVSFNLTGVTADYGTEKIVMDGDSFSVKLSPLTGDTLGVHVTMDGQSVTDTVGADGIVTIETVTGDVVIEAWSVHESQNYRWSFDGTDLVNSRGENALTKTAGTTGTNGIFSTTRYSLERPVMLLHDQPWVVEWRSEGTWKNTSGSGGRLFTTTPVNADYNARYIFKSSTNGLIALGEKTTTGSHNYGIALADHGINASAAHTYRLENRVSSDGSNMVWLYVDGMEIGPMTGYYIGTASQGTTSNWLSGKDFTFPYIGTDTHGLNNCSIDYVQVWEGGAPDKADDLGDFYGKTLSILGDSISTFSGVSNNTSYNSTIGSNAVYYSNGTLGITREDTWWQQTIDALGMELLVNNSWSGSTVFYPRKGAESVGYGPRCENLHNDKTGEEPDVIAVFLGTNDFSYYQDTLGTADAVDYASLVQEKADGSYTIATPATTCEAYALMLRLMTLRYPDADIYCMTLTARRDPDKADSYADVGQPTAFNAELKKIIEFYGCTVVDLENCGIPKNAADFDYYMGDGRVHPNEEGMDKITQALINAMVGEKLTWYTVSSNAELDVMDFVPGGMGFGCMLPTGAGIHVSATMGGVDITAQCVTDSSMHIPEVTGDIVITVAREPQSYRWEFNGTDLTSITIGGNAGNGLTKLAGTTTNGVFSNTRYDMVIPVELRHNEPWIVEWRGEGAGGFMLSDNTSSSNSTSYFFRRAGNYLNAFGHYRSGSHHNYGLALTDTEFDGAAMHTYRLVNEIAADGSNMVSLYVDGQKAGDLTQYYIGGTDYQNPDTWISGQDFTFRYIGTTSHPLTNYAMEYLQIWEGGCTHSYETEVTAPTCTEQGYTTHTCTTCGDSYVDTYVNATGHTYGAWTVTTAATCTANGTERRDCNNCDHYETREIAAKGHTEVIDKAVAATCTATGLTEGKHCSVCNTVLTAQTTIPAKGHTWDNGKVTKEPTEQTAGVKTYTCTTCGATKTETIPALNHTHKYTDKVTAPTCTEQGYTTHTCTLCDNSYVGDYVDATEHSYENGTCTRCGVANWDTDGDGVLEILAIGNSFSIDALQYAYQIAQNLGIEDIVIGNLYISGCTLATHAANAAGDIAKYTYYFNDSGAWSTTSNYKISTALTDRSWDFVSMQQSSRYSGVESTYNEDLTNLIAYVQERSTAKLVWHMTWAYQQDSTNAAFPIYGSDQMTMYNAIVSAVQNKIVTNNAFDLIVPNGTAVQNSRTSLLGDTTTRDGYHMSRNYGQYMTGLLFIKTVTGLFVDDITYAPSGVDAQEMAIAIESVNNAYANPFEVTESAYTGEIPDEGYILLQSELYKGAFWSPISERYNELFYDRSMSHKYFATIRFTRETLPIGSIIILADGWQYRPDGWITDTVQTEPREPMTTESYVVVTEEWWGDYTIRSFNIAKVGLPPLTDVTEEEVRAAFQIYVPEEKHFHIYVSIVTAPTCSEQGYTIHTCTTCGENYVDSYLNATGHAFGEWVVTTATTCIAKGSERRDCANCDHYETREIAAKGHTEVIDKAVAATCTTTGLTEGKHCSVCGTVLTAQTTIAAKGHAYGTWTVTTAATCTAKGTERRDCNNCDHYETREIAAKGHTEVIDKAVAATCTTTGLTEGKHCSVCNTVLTAQTTIPAKGHTWDNGKVTKEPTEETAGVKTFACTTCGTTKTETIPALNHTHKYTDKVTAPTCTEKGYTTHTCTCGDSYVDTYVDAKGHTEVIDKAVSATCTATGLTEGKHCSVCGTVLTAQKEVAALGHSWDVGVVTKDPTESEEGESVFTCQTCGETKTQKLPTLSHTHEYDSTVTLPTCTAQGYTTHTCSCGDAYVDSYVEATGHTAGEWISDKTGHWRTCESCDEILDIGVHDGSSCTVCGHEAPSQDHGFKPGDVNHDGKINAKDSTLILQKSVGVLKDTAFFCETCAEVSGDGKLNAKDATLILQYSVGLLTEFPAQQ